MHAARVLPDDRADIVAGEAARGLALRSLPAAREPARDAGGAPDTGGASGASAHDPQFYEQLLETAPDGIIVVDADGRICLVNRKAELLFGWERGELIGQLVDVLVPAAARAAHPGHRAFYMADPRNRPMGSTLDLKAMRADGTQFAVDISLSPLTTTLGTFVSAAVRDATDRKNTEQELRDANLSLQTAVRELQTRSRDMAALSRASQVMQSCGLLEEAIEVIARAAGSLFEGVPGALYVVTEHDSVVEHRSSWSGHPTEPAFHADECWALRTGRVHAPGSDLLALPCRHADTTGAWRICVPLVAQNETLGLIHLRELAEPVAAHERQRVHELATIVRDQWSLTLANLRLRDSLRDRSVRDALTGLFNRRFLDEALEREFQRARRRDAELAVVMIDVDHFKAFNDQHGHHGGDLVLRDLGRLLLEATRGEDIVARYGGEEFVVLLPDTPLHAAARRIERLTEAWARRGADAHQHLQPFPTLSAGVASSAFSGRSARELLAAADQALYAAKRAGRNRIVTEVTRVADPLGADDTPACHPPAGCRGGSDGV